MKRIIFSFYIRTGDSNVDKFEKHFDKLLDTQADYADNIGVPYIFYNNDWQYKEFAKQFESRPEISQYNIINFYKIHLMYELSKYYDEILYLDLDVIPFTNDNFFDVWNFKNAITIYNTNNLVNRRTGISSLRHGIRSPSAKYYNAQAMLINKGLSPLNDVFNTGIVGITKDQLKELDYFTNFDNTLEFMKELHNDELYPKNVREMFGYDNETLFSYKVKLNNCKVQWLNDNWHYFFDKQGFIPKETKFVHAINKDFDTVWRFYARYR